MTASGLPPVWRGSSALVLRRCPGHKGIDVEPDGMTFFTCFDDQGQLIARCQTREEIEALRRRGRPIAEVRELKPEESVVCSLTGSPSEFNEDL